MRGRPVPTAPKRANATRSRSPGARARRGRAGSAGKGGLQTRARRSRPLLASDASCVPALLPRPHLRSGERVAFHCHLGKNLRPQRVRTSHRGHRPSAGHSEGARAPPGRLSLDSGGDPKPSCVCCSPAGASCGKPAELRPWRPQVLDRARAGPRRGWTAPRPPALGEGSRVAVPRLGLRHSRSCAKQFCDALWGRGRPLGAVKPHSEAQSQRKQARTPFPLRGRR